MEILYIFRKRRKENYSIEGLFDSIISKINMKGIDASKVELPFYSNGLFKRLANIIYSWALKSDLFHVTGDTHYVTFLLPKKRTILTIHDCGPLAYKQGFKASLYRLLWLKIPCSRSALVTTVSKKTKDDLVELCNVNPRKIHVVHNFISEDFVYKNNIRRTDNSILTIGTKENKNLPNIIKVADSLNLSMNIVGPINDNIRSLLIKHNIDFKNYVDISIEELKSLYSSSSALMFPSTFEGFGLPIIEAQVMRTPVITSNIEPMCSVAGSGAVLVDPLSYESILSGTRELFTNENLRMNIIDQGVRNSEKYTLENTTKSYMTIYNKLLMVD